MTDMTLSRRYLLAGASATAAAGLLGEALPAAAKAPLLKTQAPAFYRFNVGTGEPHAVIIEKRRDLFATGHKPYTFRIFIDDQYYGTYQGDAWVQAGGA